MCTPYTYRICRPSLVDLGYLRNLKSALATPIAGDAKKKNKQHGGFQEGTD